MATTDGNTPSATREWSVDEVPERVRLLGDDGDRTRFGILDCPRLVRGRSTPRFSLVVLLTRAPGASDDVIRPLIASSYLGMELDYGVPHERLAQLQAQPLFARAATLSLHATHGVGASAGGPIASNVLNAPRVRGALHAHLDRTATLDVLDALSGTASSLVLRAHIEFRASGRCAAHATTDSAGDSVRHVDLECTLDAVLGDALTADDRAACVRLVGPGGDLDRGILLERLERSVSTPTRGAGRPHALAAMVAGNKIQTVAATLQPSAHASSTAHLLATEAIRIQLPATQPTAHPAHAVVSHFVLPAGVFLTPSAAAASMPVLTNLDAPLLADKVDSSARWYLPQVAVVKPAANMSPDVSPFLFHVERIGTGATGQPAIRAKVLITCDLVKSADVDAAIKANASLNVRMVEPVGLSVVLSVPFIDEATGTIKRATYHGTTVRAGNRLQTTIELLNDAARITYGSLSTPGFQSEPARLEVSYQFTGYALVSDRLSLLFGGKIAQALVLPKRRDAIDGVVISSNGREEIFRPMQALAIRPDVTMAGRITTSSVAAALPSKLQYVQRTSVRQQVLDIFMACAELGAFYREKQATATVAIGCAEAYKLGQASTRMYQEVASLNHETFRVFRNVQQPGRFLLVPLTYAITRYAPSVPEREYRPALLVYAALDAEHPANNRVRFEAMLGPAIPPHAFEELRRKLTLEAQDPVVEFPNILAQRTEFRWNLTATPPVDATTTATPENLHVALATDLASALLLKTVIQNSGLSGEARFTFEDGSTITSALSVQLGRIVGPWPLGPVALQRGAGTLTLSNRIEGSVAVKDVYLFNGATTPRRVAVERSIAPAATLEVAASGDYSVAHVDAVPVGDTPPTFEEVRAMVEEIQCNVVFVDLVNYENHGIARLHIDARLRGVPGVSRVVMTERRGSVDFLLPLTTYLAARVVEFRITQEFAGTPAQLTGWIPWDMETSSNVVTITSETLNN